MIKTKIYFGFLVLFFVAIMLFSLVFYKKSSFIESSFATGYSFLESASAHLLSEEPAEKETPITVYNNPAGSSENPNEEISCAFTPPTEKTIIIRLDDVGAWHYYNTTLNLTNEIVDKRNMSLVYGVIPDGLEKDQPFIDFIHSRRNDPRIEIAQHGNIHTESEFLTKTYDEAYLAIQNGSNSIINNLKVAPVTFVPPQNEYNQATVDALRDSGFRILSARDSEYKTDGAINFIGSDTETFDFSHTGSVPVDEVLSDCQASLQMKNVCVIVLHPQDYTYTDNAFQIDPTKHAEFIRLLDELLLLETEFKTFKDMVQCN